jgi:hypothetical protein
LVRVIPTEELAFRGLGFFLLLYLLTEIFNPKVSKKRQVLIWYITIVLIGLIFGLFHLPKFMVNPPPYPISVPIIYLCVLGILFGICRYKYGLFSAIILHFANNIFADAIIYWGILLA